MAFAWSAAIFARGAEPPRDRTQEFLERKVQADPEDFIAWNQLGNRFLPAQRETGEDTWLDRAAQAATASLKAVPEDSNPGGLALQARVDIASHRFADAKERALRLRESQPRKTGPLLLLADALLELGDLEAAARTLDEIASLADAPIELDTRRARLAIARGHHDEARTRFTAARNSTATLAPAQPAVLAWCELQLGGLAFRTGDWKTAEARYLAALAAMPDWWSALDHLAELRGAEGRTDEAFAIYDKIIARAPRPELLQTVGDLHLFLGNADAARPWHDRALAAYTRAGEQGSVAYFHHLAGFHCDSMPDPKAAVAAARKDLTLRHSAAAHDALAWALYKSGDLPAALAESNLALATGLRDAHVLHHAGMIRISAGDVARGQAALREAVAVNPRFNAFHAHR